MPLAIKSRYPLFWHAIYPEEVSQITWPMCQICKRWVKAPTAIPRCNWCGSSEITTDTHQGARSITLRKSGNKNILTEFDERGRETVNFKYLTSHSMIEFGLVDMLVDPYRYYNINLATGMVVVEIPEANSRVPISPAIYQQTTDGINYIPVSSQQKRYGDLVHFKHSIIGGKGSRQKRERLAEAVLKLENLDAIVVTNIAVGYRYNFNDKQGTVLINVNCDTHIPNLIIHED